MFSVGISWVYVSIHDHGGTPAFLAIPMVGIFAAFLAFFPAMVFSLRYALFGQHHAWLTIPVFWFLQEWLRSCAEGESDAGCQQLAVACHSAFGGKMRSELASLLPPVD